MPIYIELKQQSLELCTSFFLVYQHKANYKSIYSNSLHTLNTFVLEHFQL